MLLLLVALALLDHPRWQIREGVTRALSPANSLTLPFLECLEARGSAETHRRCKRLVDRWYAGRADRLSRELGKLPWIDPDVAGDVCPWLELAGPGDAGPDWPRWREATRVLVASRIAHRQPYRRLLSDLWAAEIYWRWQNFYWEGGTP